MTYSETELITSINQLAPELSKGHVTVSDLRGVDQYHSGGIEAVDKLLDALLLSRSDRVLDVGSGLGGPARRIAEVVGCSVVGVDITPAYVEAAIELTERSGLSGLVDFLSVDIAELEVTAPFDAAVTMHVQMNVPEKAPWFAQIAERMRPGARLAVWEVCRLSDLQPTWPMPWSMDGSDSFLDTPSDLRQSIVEAGFVELAWSDETQWVSDWFATQFSPDPPAQIMPQLLADGPSRMINFAVAMTEGVVGIYSGIFIRREN